MQWRGVGAVALLGLGWALAAPAALAAKEASFWVKCDGSPAPEPITTTLGRVVAVSATFGLFGAPERPDPLLREPGAAGIAACTTALAAPALTDDFWVRRASLLQARAVHHLEAGDATAALADLASIDTVVGARSSDIFYQRSLGVGNALLTSIALAGKGDFAGASAAAARAAAIRPYAANIQHAALDIMAVDHMAGSEEAVINERLYVLLPGVSSARVDQLLATQDWARAVAMAAKLPATPLTAQVVDGGSSSLRNRLDIIERNDKLAYAEAMLGNAAAAYARLDEARAAATVLHADLERQLSGASATPDPRVGTIMSAVDSYGAATSAMVTARLALAAGKVDAAVAALSEPLKWPDNAAFATLVAAVRAAAPGATLPDAAPPGPKLQSIKFDRLFETLPPPETAAMLNGYSAQIGFGLKVSGFRTVKPKPPATFTTVEFVGATSTPGAVEEMLLLRAAELTQAAGKPGFIIVGRRDYSRWVQMTRYGTPIGPGRADGYKTEIDVEFVDPAALPPAFADAADRVLRADTVLAALWPVYQAGKPLPGVAAGK